MENKKPAGDPQKGWQLLQLFVDENGEKFSKGKHQGLASDEEKQEFAEAQAKRKAKKSETTPPEKQDDEIKVSKELFESILIKLNQLEGGEKKTSKSDLTELISVLKADKASEANRIYAEEEIDPEDYHEDGIIFTAPSQGYLITNDKKMGKYIAIPGGKRFIKFKYSAMSLTKNNTKEDEITTMCSYCSHSKKEIEWLRGHTRNGIEFYENNPKLALSKSAQFIQMASRVHNTINALDKNKLTEKAKSLGITPTGDLSKLRAEIAAKLAEQYVSADSATLASRVNQETEQKYFTE